MANPSPLTDANGEVRELMKKDFEQFRPASEVLPEILGTALAAELLQPKKPGRPLSESPKVRTGIRLDAEVVQAFKASGRDWQARVNEVLKEWLAAHPGHLWHK